jgi:hypothetical protein
MDCGYWATQKNKVHLQKGLYSFEGREYLREPMSSTFRRRCYMKSAQGGGSLAEILKSFHGMIYSYLPTGVLYLFPSDKDMQDYSKGVMNPIIQSNPCIKKWVKTGRGSSDAASLKSVNGANLFMRGAGLSQIIEGEGESGALKGISVDKVVFDEIELMDEMAIAKAIARMNNSNVKEEVYIGNPGIPGRGIDKVFSLSDQRHWFRKCSECGHFTCAELTFPDCVKIRRDGTGYIGCESCGKPVPALRGEWVPSQRDKSSHMHGYRWSCLTSPNNDPADILEAYTNPPQGNLSDVYRLLLGLPHVATEHRLTTGQVFGRCGQDVMSHGDSGPCAFGLDVGKVCHLVIGKRLGRRRYEIVKIARLPGTGDWSEISQLVRQFNCKSGVIDIRPYEASARRFQSEHAMRIYLCEYSESTTLSKSFNNKTGIVKVNRTEIHDETHSLVAGEGLTIPHISPEVRVFANQVCDPAKVLEINKKTKEGVYRYRGTEDHYRHALNYFLLAVDKIGISSPGSDYDWSHRPKKHTRVMNNYARI